MSPLLTLKNVSLSYGHVPLLDGVELALEAGERVCLVGRNGTGKSSLLRLIYGEAMPDDGEVWRRDNLRIARLEQDLPAGVAGTVFDVVAGGLQALGELVRRYHGTPLPPYPGRVTAGADRSACAGTDRVDPGTRYGGWLAV